MRLVLTAVCAVGVLFYLRFLAALWKDCRFTRVGYLVRLQPNAHEELAGEAARKKTLSQRAA